MNQCLEKKTRILDAAAEHFARLPFHKVLLSDVARAASVGKGTLYLYFTDKDDLYFAVLFRDFSTLVDRVGNLLSGNDATPEKQLAGIIRILVESLFRKAINLDIMSFARICPSTPEWRKKRAELRTFIEETLQRGIDLGVFEDNNPRLTSLYVPGLIRSACLFESEGLDVETICRHAYEFVLHGVKKQR